MMQAINPEGWPRPSGYANGIVAEGRMLFIAGQIGWDKDGNFPSDDFVDQVRQALSNIVAVLEAAGAGAEHLARLTWYITDKREYASRLPEIGAAYRDVIGRNFPVMAVMQVVALVEDRAKVEIEATAVLPVG